MPPAPIDPPPVGVRGPLPLIDGGKGPFTHSPTAPARVTEVTSGAQPPEQVVEHLLLTVRGDPVGIEHPLGAEPVDQHE